MKEKEEKEGLLLDFDNEVEDDININLWALYMSVREHLFLIIAVGLLSALITGMYTKYFVEPEYTAETTMLVLMKENTKSLTSLADLQFGTQLTNDYAELSVSRPVLNQVIRQLELNTDYKYLRSCIGIDNPDNTRLLNFSVKWDDAATAKAIADCLVATAAEFISDNMEVNTPKILDEAVMPVRRTGPNIVRMLLIGLLAGMIAATCVFCLLELLNDTIQSEEDVKRYLELPVLAIVPDKRLEVKNRHRSHNHK